MSRITLDEALTRLKDAVDAVPARPLVVQYPEGDQVSISIFVIRCHVSTMFFANYLSIDHARTHV